LFEKGLKGGKMLAMGGLDKQKWWSSRVASVGPTDTNKESKSSPAHQIAVREETTLSGYGSNNVFVLAGGDSVNPRTSTKNTVEHLASMPTHLFEKPRKYLFDVEETIYILFRRVASVGTRTSTKRP